MASQVVRAASSYSLNSFLYRSFAPTCSTEYSMLMEARIHHVHGPCVVAYIITLVLAPLWKSHPRAAAFSPLFAPKQRRQPASDTANSKLTDEPVGNRESRRCHRVSFCNSYLPHSPVTPIETSIRASQLVALTSHCTVTAHISRPIPLIDS
jgi:hypothetical protein